MSLQTFGANVYDTGKTITLLKEESLLNVYLCIPTWSEAVISASILWVSNNTL